jgi:hypothetical protein
MAAPDLIDSLVADLRPVPRGAMARRLAVGLVPGIVVSVIAMLVFLGPRPDTVTAMGTMAWWMKLAYTALLAAIGAGAIAIVARPGGTARRAALAAVAAFLVCVALALVEYAATPVAGHDATIYGRTADSCPWNIALLSLPVLAGGIWALRGLAPTHLTLAGAAVGLAAGAFASLVYSFHCYESAMPFVAIWYTLGILIAGLIGAVLGRWVLRW